MTSKMPSVVYLLTGLFLATECGSAAADERGIQIVSLAKAASGGTAWDRLEIMHDFGHVIFENGQVSRYEHWGDLRTLSTRSSGADAGYMIFDGRVAYKCPTVDCDHPTKLDSVEMRGAAYLNTFGFFFPSRFPASFEYKGTRRESGVIYDIVEATPTGLPEADIWIDHHTHLVFRSVYSNGRFRVDLTDYRKVNGVMVPFTAHSAGVTVKSEVVKFESIGLVSFSLPPPHRP